MMQDRPEDVPARPTSPPRPTPQSQPKPQPQPHAGPHPAEGHGPPQPAYPPAPPYAYGPQPGSPPPPDGKGAAGRAALWAVVGAVVASALWAGGILLLGPLGDDPDLKGYRIGTDLCSDVDYRALRTEYAERDDAPTHNSLRHEAVGQGHCSISLKRTAGSSYADAYLSVQVELHKKTDPGPEFTALWS